MMDWLRMGVIICVMGALIVILTISGINGYVIASSKSATYTTISDVQVTDYAADDIPILVFGAGIINNETPSNVLAKRLDKAFELAIAYPNKQLIMSGDHDSEYYNEVKVMKDYLVDKGIASERIYLDHAGYSTFESLYRLKHVLHQDKAIIVTQGYHLSRAIMLARSIQLEVAGVPADEVNSTRWQREVREIGARLKDFAVSYFGYRQVEPSQAYAFSFEENGDQTNDIQIGDKNTNIKSND